MPKPINNKPLTIKDIREVLIPAMEKVFATKKDLERFAGKQDLGRVKQDLATLKDELLEFKDISLSNQDRILKDLRTLKIEKAMSDDQAKRQRELCKIMVDAAQKGRLLSPEKSEEIEEPGVL